MATTPNWLQKVTDPSIFAWLLLLFVLALLELRVIVPGWVEVP